MTLTREQTAGSGGKNAASIPRYHSLDRLRASMMFLGLVFHTSIAYLSSLPEYYTWFYQDERTSPFFDWLIDFIHVFRMPVFFTVAGFFAVYLIRTRGTKEFMRHRWSRIGVPLVVGWLAIAPLMAGAVIYAGRFADAPAAGLPTDGVPENILFHLWFLYYLLIFCAAVALLAPLLRRVPESVRDRFLGAFANSLHSLSLAGLIVVSGAVLYQMRSWTIDYSGNLLPPLPALAIYGLFFCFGALLFECRHAIGSFKRPAWRNLIAGIACFIAHRYFVDAGCGSARYFEAASTGMHIGRYCDPAATGMHIGATVFLAPAVCLLVFGLLGLFLRYLDKPNSYWRYFSDASYWMYIVHPPLVMTLPTLFAGWPVPAGVKFSLVLCLAAAITLMTYHYLVRSTFIGKQLNGRRYPRTPPWQRSGESDAV